MSNSSSSELDEVQSFAELANVCMKQRYDYERKIAAQHKYTLITNRKELLKLISTALKNRILPSKAVVRISENINQTTYCEFMQYKELIKELELEIVCLVCKNAFKSSIFSEISTTRICRTCSYNNQDPKRRKINDAVVMESNSAKAST